MENPIMSIQEKQFEDNKNGRNWLLLIAGFAVLAAMAALFIGAYVPSGGDASTVAGPSQSEVALPQSGPPLEVGFQPYNFALQDLEGNSVALGDYIGRPLIINYWATWCAPCRVEMPHLQNTFEARGADGLALLALNQDESAPEVEAFFDEFGLTFTALMDEDGQTSENYGVGRILPTTFFINADGEITAIHRGPMTQGQIDGYLAETIPSS
jgi:peroxiredoxin